MKVTVAVSAPRTHTNPRVIGGKFYRILGCPSGLGSSSPGEVVFAVIGADMVQYLSDKGITYSSITFFNNNYYFEEFKGTLQIECP